MSSEEKEPLDSDDPGNWKTSPPFAELHLPETSEGYTLVIYLAKSFKGIKVDIWDKWNPPEDSELLDSHLLAWDQLTGPSKERTEVTVSIPKRE